MAKGDKYALNDKPKNGRQTFLRLVGFVGHEKRMLAVVAVLIVISIAASLGSSYMLRPIINDYILPGDIPGLIWMLIILAGVYLAGVAANWIQARILNVVGQRTVLRMRVTMFAKMERLPVAYFDGNQHGNIMSRYTNDIDRISDALTDSLANMLSSVLTLIGTFVMMLVISPLLTAISLVTVPVMYLVARFIVKRSRRYFTAQQAALGGLNGYIEEMISGQKVIKVFGQEDKVESDFEELNLDLNEKSKKAQFYSGMMMPAMQNLSTLNYVIITIAGGLLAIFRGFDVGGLAAFLQYSRQFGRPINELASIYNGIQAAIAGAERIFQIIDSPAEQADEPCAVVLPDTEGDVRMRDVVFGYEPGKIILHGVSLRVAPGCKIAIVGSTGAGKTTIMNLLPRFYDINSGQITIDGYDIRDIQRSNLREHMAMVLQDTHLFTGTVMENIRFGKLDTTDEEVIAAAKLTAAHSFIRRLQHGYNTVLENDGHNLSAGQRQLLNIARSRGRPTDTAARRSDK